MLSAHIKYHNKLAEYFGEKELYLDEKHKKRKPNTRKLVEQPWQQTKAELWDDVTNTLCDLLFIEAKIVNSMTYELIDDYNTVLKVLPEAREEVSKEEEHQARVKKYTDDIIAYASKWNEARKKHREDPIKYPIPKDEDIPLPEIIQSVEPWSDERREKEIERIINNPTRLDKVRAYSQFVISESSAFALYGTQPGFVIQHTYNNADYPHILKTAKEKVENNRGTILQLQKFRNSMYNPFPALLNKLEGHSKEVTSIAITPDGKLALSGSKDRTLRLWDLYSGECLKILERDINPPNSIAITPDGKWAVSGSWNIFVWNLESGECMKVLKGHKDLVSSIAITPDGKRAVSGSRDCTIRLWNLEIGECLKVLKGHTDTVSTIAITPDGRKVVSGSGSNSSANVGETITLWGQESKRHIEVVSSTRSKNSEARENTIRLWDLENAECLKVFEGHGSFVSSIGITPDGKRAISGSWDNTLRLWDLENESCVKILEDHRHWVHSVSITPDGRMAVSGSSDHTLRLWNLESGACQKILEGHTSSVLAVAITPDGRKSVSGGGKSIIESEGDNTLRLWDHESGESTKLLKGHTSSVNSVVITPDGKSLVSGSGDMDSQELDYSLRLWDLESGECLKVLEGHSNQVRSIAITPDGKRAVSGSWDKTLLLWDLENKTCILGLKGQLDGVWTVAIFPDGKKAIFNDHALHYFDLESLLGIKVLKEEKTSAYSVAIAPDGKSVVSINSDETLRLWDLKSGECLKILKGHTNMITSIAITPDGRKAVSAGRDKTIRLWDLINEECIRVLEGHSYDISSIAITPDGEKVVSGGKDNTIRLWDLESRKCLSICKTNSGVESLTYSGKINTIISGGVKGQIDFLQLRNLVSNIQQITIQRLWNFGRSTENGNWDEHLTALCQFCGTRLNVEEKFITSIKEINKHFGITPEMSPCLSLPDEAFESQVLFSECPNCGKAIKFNPFIIDNRDTESYNISYRNVSQYDPHLHETEGSKEQKLGEFLKLFGDYINLVNKASEKETTVEEIPLYDLYELAEQSFIKKQWEGSEALYTKLLEKGEPIDIVGPKIFSCILNAPLNLSENNLKKLYDILNQLESSGKAVLVTKLRQQLSERTTSKKENKKGWKFWK